ncbi:hypothetical protein FKP32DRAFT_710316 [Trametes sanguinea]|nr:hypothetical protein FKP32DRAFT_710316 [Trametes sanguinea]
MQEMRLNRLCPPCRIWECSYVRGPPKGMRTVDGRGAHPFRCTRKEGFRPPSGKREQAGGEERAARAEFRRGGSRNRRGIGTGRGGEGGMCTIYT